MGKPRDIRSEDLKFICEWGECQYLDGDDDKFYEHVANHIPGLKVVPSENGGEMYECSWKNCSHTSDLSNEIVQHVKAHAYHTILKAKGVAVAASRKLPSCNYTESDSNAIQLWSKPLVCQWKECSVTKEFSGVREFISHVQNHVKLYFNGSGPYPCGWSDCSFTSSTKSKVADHLKSHTGERMIACPICGNLFANTTKFTDHCIRQKTSYDDDSLKCEYCLTYLPSERLFRDHMRQHVNYHKCCFCELTCHSPSVLIEHIRYRHLPYRPFKCSSCPTACKSAFDLKQHLKIHTKDVRYFTCNEKNCNFKCSRQSVLIRHYYKAHGDDPDKEGGVFGCHLCEKKYLKGTSLTKHLRKIHNVQKPPGYSRFIYKHEGDGCYRLRQVRLECLEVMDTDSTNKVPEPSEGQPSQTIIDVLDEKGQVISSSTYMEPEIKIIETLPPDAKIVAVCSDPPQQDAS